MIISWLIVQVETKDALLHAINEEYVEAVEVLLEHEEGIHKEGEPHVRRTTVILVVNQQIAKGRAQQPASLGFNDSSISKIVGTRTQRERRRGTDMHTYRRSLQEGGTNWKE